MVINLRLTLVLKQVEKLEKKKKKTPFAPI
jgi:hypothetical protein